MFPLFSGGIFSGAENGDLMLTKDEMRAYYDSIFSDYFRYIQRFKPGILSHPVLEYYTRLKLDQLNGHHVGDVLDIGCGTAFYYPLLSEYADTITGVDYSEQMITISRQFIEENGIKGAQTMQMDMEKLEFGGRQFDTVISMDVFHHTHDIPKIIERVSHIVKPDGRFVVIEVNPNHPLALAHNLYRREERGVLRTFPWRLVPLVKRHFEIERVIYLQYFPFFLTKTPKFFLPLIKKFENFMSRLPVLRYLSVYYIIIGRPLID